MGNNLLKNNVEFQNIEQTTKRKKNCQTRKIIITLIEALPYSVTVECHRSGIFEKVFFQMYVSLLSAVHSSDNGCIICTTLTAQISILTTLSQVLFSFCCQPGESVATCHPFCTIVLNAFNFWLTIWVPEKELIVKLFSKCVSLSTSV